MSYVIRPVENETQSERHKKLAAQSEAKLPTAVAKLKIDLKKVNLEAIIREWVDNELEALLPEDDDIMKSYVEELLRSQTDVLSGGELHLQVSEFLGETDAVKFITSLWKVLESAINDKEGIPQIIRDKRDGRLRKTTVSKTTDDNKVQRPQKTVAEAKRTNYNRSKSNSSESKENTRDRKEPSKDRLRESEDSRYRRSNYNSNYRSRT